MRFHPLRHTVVTGDEFGRSTTATADNIDQSLVEELLDFRSHTLSRLVILPHLVRQSGVRMGADIPWRHCPHALDERFHLRSTEGTVHAHRKDRIRREAGQESLDGLSAQGTTSQIAHGQTHHDRQVHTMLLHRGKRRIDHRLTVERIKDSFDENHIHTTLDETVDLLASILKKFIIRNLTCRRIAHVRTHTARFVGRTHIARHKTRLVISAEKVALYACQPGSLVSHFPGLIFQVIISL